MSKDGAWQYASNRIASAVNRQTFPEMSEDRYASLTSLLNSLSPCSDKSGNATGSKGRNDS